MLIDVGSGRILSRVPFEPEFEGLRRRLTTGEFEAMVARVNELIDAAGGEIATAGWLPGSDWTGTPFEPIYATAARSDQERAAKFFGQIVWFTIMGRPESWGSGRYEVDGRDI